MAVIGRMLGMLVLIGLVVVGQAVAAPVLADEFEPDRYGPGATRGWVRVPEVVGMDEAQARHTLSQAGLQARAHRVVVPRRECAGQKAGLVIRQSPHSGENQRRGGWVEITLCPDRHRDRRVIMPDLHGLALVQARALLGGLGIKSRLERRPACPSPELAGKVVGQSLDPGAQVKPGVVVVLRYCPSPDPGLGVPVP